MEEGLDYSYVEDEREDDRYAERLMVEQMPTEVLKNQVGLSSSPTEQPTLDQWQAILIQLQEEGLTPEEIDEWIKLQDNL